MSTPTKRLTGSRCQCTACGDYFNSTFAFDGHRTGSFRSGNRPNTRRCLAPAELEAKGWLRNDAGFWITCRRELEARTERAEAATEDGPLG